MIKKLLMTAVAAAAMIGTANAASLVAENGSAATFAAPAGVVTTFNGGSLGAGFTLTGGSIVSGTLAGVYAQPAFSDGSQYLDVVPGNPATLQSLTGYQSVSFFLGSIDTFNSVQVLDTAGNVIATFTGSQLALPAAANGNQTIADTNRRLTIFRSTGDALIGGIKFFSTSGNLSGFSLEVDNVVFAVPEPATWMMMLGGFAFVGGAMRSRRRNKPTTVLA